MSDIELRSIVFRRVETALFSFIPHLMGDQLEKITLKIVDDIFQEINEKFEVTYQKRNG